ncbi:MAG: metallopeptidase family protein [Phycisphaerae bacterium]
MDPDRFQTLVDEAVASLPADLARRMENVDVVVAAAPSARLRREMGIRPGGTLLGAYRGVPQTRRTHAYGAVGPDQIVIFRGPVLAAARQAAEDGQGGLDEAIRGQVRRTVLHEIGHHFGLGEGDLRRLGYG